MQFKLKEGDCIQQKNSAIRGYISKIYSNVADVHLFTVPKMVRTIPLYQMKKIQENEISKEEKKSLKKIRKIAYLRNVALSLFGELLKMQYSERSAFMAMCNFLSVSPNQVEYLRKNINNKYKCHIKLNSIDLNKIKWRYNQVKMENISKKSDLDTDKIKKEPFVQYIA